MYMDANFGENNNRNTDENKPLDQEINGNAPAEEKEAEHVISYRDSETPSTYHMTGDQLVKDDANTKSEPVFEAPRYNATYTEGGDATYAPAPEKKKKIKKEKSSGGIVGKIVLVAVCVLLS